MGDIVILKNESTKRIFWKIAKVEELIRSEDDGVRAAKIRVLNSDNRRSIIMRRPIQHLIPLEIRAATGKDNNASEEPPKAEEPIEEPEKNAAKASIVEKKNRPKRKAAAQGELIRKLSEQL